MWRREHKIYVVISCKFHVISRLQRSVAQICAAGPGQGALTMLGDIFKSPVLGELKSPSSVFDFRWSVGSLGSLGSPTSPQVPEKVEKTPGPVIKVGTCKCCSGNGSAAFDEDLLEASGPSFRVSNVNDVMQHWADVDGDFLQATPTPGSTSKAADSQNSNLHSHHSPADDWISEMLNDMEQFGQTNGLEHLWLKRAARARQSEKSLENVKNI